MQLSRGNAWIGGGATLLAALIAGIFTLHLWNSQPSTFSGTVVAANNLPIGLAKILVAQGQQTPQTLYSDANGIFHFELGDKISTLRITVSASGFETITHDADPHRSGPEEFILKPILVTRPKAVPPIVKHITTHGDNSPIIVGDRNSVSR
jgi:hypothetical protein